MYRLASIIMTSMLLVSCSNGTSSSPRSEVSWNEQSGFQNGDYTLYRINGDRYPGSPVPEGSELLHGWEILESCILLSSYDRALLFKAFRDGEAEMSGSERVLPDCFRPRHAIRTVVDDRTTDYLICFECSRYMVWVNGDQTAGGTTTNSPEKTFNAMLADCGADGFINSGSP